MLAHVMLSWVSCGYFKHNFLTSNNKEGLSSLAMAYQKEDLSFPSSLPSSLADSREQKRRPSARTQSKCRMYQESGETLYQGGLG